MAKLKIAVKFNLVNLLHEGSKLVVGNFINEVNQ